MHFVVHCRGVSSTHERHARRAGQMAMPHHRYKYAQPLLGIHGGKIKDFNNAKSWSLRPSIGIPNARVAGRYRSRRGIQAENWVRFRNMR